MARIPSPSHPKRTAALALTLCAALCFGGAARAQDPDPTLLDPQPPSLDWYYAAAWGTGAYRAGERSVYVVRAPFSVELPEPESGRWRARVLLPVSVGVVDFDLRDITGNPVESVSSVLFTPGIEFTVPAGPDWTLKPFATVGGGVELAGDESALIASAGLHATRPLGCGAWRCTLGVGLTWAGYRPDSADPDGMALFHLGVDTVSDVGPTVGGRRLALGAYAVYRDYLDSLDFLLLDDEIASLDREWEVGFTFNASEPWHLFGFPFERVGLGFRFGRRLEGFRLVTSLPF